MYFKEIDISKIKPLPEGQRPALPELTNEEYREMKENIQKYGILQNLVVTEERSNGKISAYILQAGYTRFQIAGELEMETVPCNVEDDEFSLALRCSTDAFRRNLSSRDRRELIKYLGYAEEGDGTGKHRKYSTDSPEVQKLKQEIEENSKKIKAMEAELEESNRIALENIDGLKEQIEASKKQEVNMTETLKSVRTLLKTEQENFKRFKADLKEKKFVGSDDDPSKREIEKRIKEGVKDAEKQVERAQALLEAERKKSEELAEKLQREESRLKSINANQNAIMARNREIFWAHYEVSVIDEVA